MNAPYHVVILGPDALGRRAHLVARLEEAFRALGLDPAKWVAVGSTLPAGDDVVSCVLYLGDSPAHSHDAEIIEAMSRSMRIIPVAPALTDVPTMIPAPLGQLQVAAWTPAASAAQVGNFVLEALSLLRERRRVFISYRRTHSMVAAQLYEALDQRGYDAFLDTIALRPGHDFQAGLWHRLADSDLMVVLGTDNFIESRWTREEAANANALGVSVLQVMWPSVAIPPVATLWAPVYLDATDFAGQPDDASARWTLSALDRVVEEVELLRAKALAARQARLTRTALLLAKDANLTVRQSRAFLEIEDGHGKSYRIATVTGVPDAADYEEVERVCERHACGSEVRVLHDNAHLLPEWTRHLDWLDGHVPVKRLGLDELPDWIASVSRPPANPPEPGCPATSPASNEERNPAAPIPGDTPGDENR